MPPFDKLATETLVMVRDSKLIPHSQRGTDVNYQVAVLNDCSSWSSRTAYSKLVVSRPGSRTIDIYSKIGEGLQGEHSYGENRRGVSAISRGKVCRGVNYCSTPNCAGSAKCGEIAVDSDISRAGAGTICVINQQCATVYDRPTAVNVLAGKCPGSDPVLCQRDRRTIPVFSNIAAY
jgi:hypothetical protein